MRKHVIAGLATALSFISLPAVAADNGFYLGASVGQSGVEVDEVVGGFDLNYDSSATAYKLIAGWRFLDWLSVEANYVDLGTADDRIDGVDFEADVSGFSLFEEAQYRGVLAAERTLRRLGLRFRSSLV